MRTHTYHTIEGDFSIPEEWKILLGEEVLALEKTVVSRLSYLHIGRTSFIDLCKQLDDFKEWYDEKAQRACSQRNRQKQRVIIEGSSKFLLPDDWKEFLGEDVLQCKIRLSVRLEALKISRAKFLKRMSSCEEFMLWWKQSDQAYLSNKELATKEIRDKAKATIEERYKNGVMSDSAVQEKYKKTIRERYGVDHPFKSQEIKHKISETLLMKYGVLSPFNSEDIRNKARETCLTKYGKINPVSWTQEECDKRLNLWNLQRLEEFKGVSYPLKVKCKTCGLEFFTNWVSGHQGELNQRFVQLVIRIQRILKMQSPQF